MTLTCEASGGSDEPTISWQYRKNHKYPWEDAGFRGAQVTRLTRSAHMGHYRCIANNTMGEVSSGSIILMVPNAENSFDCTCKSHECGFVHDNQKPWVSQILLRDVYEGNILGSATHAVFPGDGPFYQKGCPSNGWW